MKTDKQLLKEMGFQGFVTIGELMNNSMGLVPSQMGVYVILRETDEKPRFLSKGSGGFFKGNDPNVSLSKLLNNWVDDTHIVYIGKAGGHGNVSTLYKRLGQYMRFGQGESVGHWGGRYIWQLADSRDLLVCWKPLSVEEPREVEKRMIEAFKDAHKGKRPFANLID